VSPRELAQKATIIERRGAEAAALMRELFPLTGRARIYGVTGAPGAGKSTLVNAMTDELRAKRLRVGIIAVDPSSPYTGGAILGDRIRMQSHYADEQVFIRSMAARGAMGGLAPATLDMALLMDAAGMDAVIVETVGVGQDEVDIARLADVTLVVLTPGMGDDVQAIKAGILEIADVFVINKADQAGAEKLERELRSSLTLGARADGWEPPVVKTIASEGKGISELFEAAEGYLARGASAERTQRHWRERLREMYRERLLEALPSEELERAAREVAARRTDPYGIVEAWIEAGVANKKNRDTEIRK
jgi:LAO/AO transport system kinase